MSRCSNAIPAPRATANSGSAASLTGMPVSARILSGNPTSKEPPPARVMPRSMMSADNSGGVLSRVIFTASTMEATGSSIASRISTVLITTGRGSPVTKSRPRNSALCSSRSGVAEYERTIKIELAASLESLSFVNVVVDLEENS